MPTAVLSLNGVPQLELRAGADAVEAVGASPPAKAGDSTQRVMRLLGSKIRIKITDGRVVVGTFHCLDKHQNVILTDTREYLALQRPASAAGASANGKKSGGGHKQQPKHQQQEDDREEEEKELWKTGTSRGLGMALVPGKHIVYIKVERATTEQS